MTNKVRPATDQHGWADPGNSVQYVRPRHCPRSPGQGHAHSVNLDPTGQFIVIIDLGVVLLRVFVADSVMGELTKL
jgi:6-phosphogluconolactonase (cycloisomerase 2 family)